MEQRSKRRGESSIGIFIDSSIFIAFANSRDRDHARAERLMNEVRKLEFGTRFAADYVFDEAVTASLARTRRPETAIKVGKLIIGSTGESIPSIARLIRVDEKTFADAWETFKAGRFEGLSFTDHTILAQLKAFKIDMLLSFDSHFDGLAPRVS